MTTVLELEGTWEEIQARSAELAEKRLRVSVLPDAKTIPQPLDAENLRMLTRFLERLSGHGCRRKCLFPRFAELERRPIH